jgi:folylpolyglutamate synthase/dihydropteroate synthase
VPVKAQPKERPIIQMLLSACDDGAWQQAHLDWVEEKQDGAVEVIATRADNPRAAAPHEIAEVARPTSTEVLEEEAVPAALDRARALAGSKGVVVITGSIYIVGEALRLLNQVRQSV